MTTFKDYFSKQASEYARRRPHYPPELFQYLASVAPSNETAWDCGTDNGQAAVGLAPYFKRVIATDPSEDQLRNAFPHEKVEYRQARAEEPGIAPSSLDLITVAQAVHWFDIPKFFAEAKLALKPGGVIAVWCYTMCRISPELDLLADGFYFDTVGPYWPAERKLVDDEYRSLVFPFDEFKPPEFNIELSWDLGDLLGYLRTWSPTRRFIERNSYDPVDEVAPALATAWGDPNEQRPVRWPIHMRIGRASGVGDQGSVRAADVRGRGSGVS
jgi:SAM-dependent methyltransferase